MNIAYLAGLVDGEGCLRLHPSNSGKYRKYYPRIQVTNTYRQVLDLLASTFGGAVRQKPASSLGKKEVFDWVLTGDKARQLLTELVPHLIIKREKALDVLQGDMKTRNNA